MTLHYNAESIIRHLLPTEHPLPKKTLHDNFPNNFILGFVIHVWSGNSPETTNEIQHNRGVPVGDISIR